VTPTEQSAKKPSATTGSLATLRASVSTGRTRLALLLAAPACLSSLVEGALLGALTAAPAFAAPAHGILNWRAGGDS